MENVEKNGDGQAVKEGMQLPFTTWLQHFTLISNCIVRTVFLLFHRSNNNKKNTFLLKDLQGLNDRSVQTSPPHLHFWCYRFNNRWKRLCVLHQKVSLTFYSFIAPIYHILCQKSSRELCPSIQTGSCCLHVSTVKPLRSIDTRLRRASCQPVSGWSIHPHCNTPSTWAAPEEAASYQSSKLQQLL